MLSDSVRFSFFFSFFFKVPKASGALGLYQMMIFQGWVIYSSRRLSSSLQMQDCIYFHNLSSRAYFFRLARPHCTRPQHPPNRPQNPNLLITFPRWLIRGRGGEGGGQGALSSPRRRPRRLRYATGEPTGRHRGSPKDAGILRQALLGYGASVFCRCALAGRGCGGGSRG